MKKGTKERPWVPPFKLECGSVFDSNGHKLLDMRGWGYLSGKGVGGLGIEGDEAAKIQDQWGVLVAQLLNDHFTNMDRDGHVCHACDGTGICD